MMKRIAVFLLGGGTWILLSMSQACSCGSSNQADALDSGGPADTGDTDSDGGGIKTTITSAPEAITNQTTAEFRFLSNIATATFECKLDDAVFTACTSPQTYSSLKDGEHFFSVQAKDQNGRFEETPTTYTWEIDTTAPVATIDQGPVAITNETEALFVFSSADPEATYECRLDTVEFAPCSSPQSYAGLADGPHNFKVRTIDSLGNVQASPTQYSWVVDTVAPVATITKKPYPLSPNPNPLFEFSSDLEASTFVCKIDESAYSGCTSPKGYSNLGNGSHLFQVRAEDSAGNVQESPTAYSWTVDLASPDITVVPNQVSPSNNQLRFDFYADKAVQGFQCAFDLIAYNGCTSPVFYNDLELGAHSFKVKAVTDGISSEIESHDFLVNRKMLKTAVFLMDFPDKGHQLAYNQSFFEDLLSITPGSGARNGSFTHYFNEVSAGKMEIQGRVFDWKPAAKNASYYCYGPFLPAPCNGSITHATELVNEAIDAWKSTVDFGEFDGNNDGFIDAIFLVHAYCGAESMGSCPDSQIHSHASMTLYDTGAHNSLGQAVYAFKYTMLPEFTRFDGLEILPATIGVFVHEFVHVLGIPDLYDTSNQSSGLGDWSVMASGNWLGPGQNGSWPSHLDAWSKIRLGWAEVITLNGTQAVTVNYMEGANGKVFKILANGSANEYFLIENRQQTLFDQYLPGAGLLIYHVDTQVVNANWILNKVNATPGWPGNSYCTKHYGVGLVQADDLWDLEQDVYNTVDSGDPFPGTTLKTAFNGSSSPANLTFCDMESGFSIDSLSASGNVMSFDFIIGN